MADKNMKSKALDDFWDISSLVPQKNVRRMSVSKPETVEIREKNAPIVNNTQNDDSSIIKRYVPPYGGDQRLTRNNDFDLIERYEPCGSLIHSVTVKKRKSSYNYYSGFMRDALKYADMSGNPCEYVPFFSYVPQYDQLSEEQLAYYLWFRENERNGKHIKTDEGYLFLYVFELLNLGARMDTKRSQYLLTEIWKEYAVRFPALGSKLGIWICDYSLLHHLGAPTNASSDLLKNVYSLKEFYVDLPRDNIKACAVSLIRYCTSYDYRNSKFYNNETAELFERHVLGALCEAIKFYSQNGEILSGISFDDSMIERDAYAGALCVAEERYRLEIRYCSFSRSNELRFLVGDIIKYAENRLRIYLGIRSKMTVYSVSVELKRILDSYFDLNLPSKRIVKPSEEKHEYDVLYESVKKEFSLEDAMNIEKKSWDTTKALVEAFEEEYNEDAVSDNETLTMELKTKESKKMANETATENGTELLSAFGEYADVIRALFDGKHNAVSTYAREHGMLSDSLIDEINEKAFDLIGDTLIEDFGDGFKIIDDYRDLFDEKKKG